MFMMVDYVRKMTAKKSCKYGEYGLFERVLFLFILFLICMFKISIYGMMFICVIM